AHGLLQILVGQDALVGVGRAAVVRLEMQLLHVRSGLVAAGVEALLGVVGPRFQNVLGPAHEVVHQADREEVRLLVGTTGRAFPCSAPLRLVSCARRKNSASSWSLSRSASST